MKEHRQILEQIHRMRDKRVEPETVTLSPELHSRMGRPHRIGGVCVDCDGRIKNGFEVR
jgi:hypothetical protein